MDLLKLFYKFIKSKSIVRFLSSNRIFKTLCILFGNSVALFIAYLYYLYKTTNLRCRQTGGDIVANVFKKFGIRQIFTLTGGHISPILVSSERLGIKVIDVRNEANAVFAADAVSRISPDGQIGVAVVTAGPELQIVLLLVEMLK